MQKISAACARTFLLGGVALLSACSAALPPQELLDARSAYTQAQNGPAADYAPAKLEYPLNRYSMEAKRQFDVLNRRLADSEHIAGPDYTIADIAIWPWYGGIALGRSYEGADTFLATHEYEHVLRWAKAIDERPAVRRGRIVNRLSGDEREQLHERHDPSDFELRTEDKVPRTPEVEDLAAAKDDAI